MAILQCSTFYLLPSAFTQGSYSGVSVNKIILAGTVGPRCNFLF